MLNRFIDKIKFILKLSNLGANIFSKFYIALIIIWISIRDKLKIKQNKEFIFNLSLNNFNFNFHFLGNHHELLMMNEIFCNQEYNVSIVNPKNIIDLGSNIGISSVFFATKFPNAKIYCVEPDPDTFNILIKNCSQFKNIKAFNLAIYDKNSEIIFFKNKKHNASSLIKREANDIEIKINCTTLDNLINSNDIDKVDLLKFDIEGGEFKVFKDFNNWIKILNIVGEIHNDLNTEDDFDLLNLLEIHFNLNIEQGGKKERVIVKGAKNV